MNIKTYIHPHNEALQLIDAKLRKLNQTLEYVLNGEKVSTYVRDKEFNELKQRIFLLEKSKQILMTAGELITSEDYYQRFPHLIISDKIAKLGKYNNDRFKKRILAINNEGVEMKFESHIECAKELGISRHTIYDSLIKNRPTRTGYKFRRL